VSGRARPRALTLARAYRLLLALYPARFRAEFGREMGEVFAAAWNNAQGSGGARPWTLLWREIRDWPGSALREHLRERRYKMPLHGWTEDKPLPRGELLVALLLFLLPLLMPLSSTLYAAGLRLPPWVGNAATILVLGALLGALGFGLAKGLPRWSLAYLGLAAMVGLILSRYGRIWDWIYPPFIRAFGPRVMWPIPVRILYTGTFAAIHLLSFLAIGLALALLLRVLPHTRAIWRRVRADWTQLSYLFYGGLVIAVHLLFEEYRPRSLAQLLPGLCLALGAWFYLRAKGHRGRIRALIGGASGAMWTAALAKWLLIPLQAWPTGYPVAPSPTTRWVETGSTFVEWAGILLVLLAPALLDLLPRAPAPVAAEGESPVTA
jgi:hypothetical protein